jgi:DNA-binding transcriptional LysR family regulator
MADLDIDQLRALVVVADLKGFTAAGEVLGERQSVMSVRIAKLEAHLGHRLLARTPRSVTLTPEGALFLPHARAVLTAHDAALGAFDRREAPVALRLAISDQAMGAHLPAALGALRAAVPSVVPDVEVGPSAEIRARYEAGDCDAAIIRREAGPQRGDHPDGRPLFADRLVWVAGPGFQLQADAPVPLVVLRGACGVKSAALRALELAARPAHVRFSGGSVVALQAAVAAGFGVTVLGQRHVPPGCRVLGTEEGLPALSGGEVTLLTRLTGTLPRAIAAAFQRAGQGLGQVVQPVA